MRALQRFEKAYIQSLLDRIQEPLRRALSGRSNQMAEEMGLVCKHVSMQIDVARNNPLLVTATIDCLTQVIDLFCSQMQEKQVKTEEAYHVLEKANSGQLQNGLLFNAAFRLYDTLATLSRKAPAKLQDQLQGLVAKLYDACTCVLDPQFQKQTILVERILLTLHNTDYSTTSAAPGEREASRFLQILRKQVQSFCTVILPLYTPCALIDERSISLAQRIFQYFVRQAALIRPLSDSGKMRLAGDMAQLESAVTPLVIPKNVGESYHQLRSFKSFIFLEASGIPESLEIIKLLPVDVLHHLLTRGSREIKSPHEHLGWTLAKYSAWLDTAAPSQVYPVLQKCLNNYAQQIDQRGEKEYDPVYPLILSLLSRFGGV